MFIYCHHYHSFFILYWISEYMLISIFVYSETCKYIKTTLETRKMWSLSAGGLDIQVHFKHDKNS